MSASTQPTMKKITNDNGSKRTTAAQLRDCQQSSSECIRQPRGSTSVTASSIRSPYSYECHRRSLWNTIWADVWTLFEHTAEDEHWTLHWGPSTVVRLEKSLPLQDRQHATQQEKVAYLQGLVTVKAKDVILQFFISTATDNSTMMPCKNSKKNWKSNDNCQCVHTTTLELLNHQPPIKENPESYINHKAFIKGIIRNLQHLEHTADLESSTKLRHAFKK